MVRHVDREMAFPLEGKASHHHPQQLEEKNLHLLLIALILRGRREEIYYVELILRLMGLRLLSPIVVM